MEEPPGKKKQRAASLIPDDLITEIIARVPYRSICRFKCVSRAWLALCSDPGFRLKCPQTLSGFFFFLRYIRSFVNVSGRGRPMIDPSLSFLPRRRGRRYAKFIDCCNGLLLCRREDLDPYHFFVCNPATEKWIDLPKYTRGTNLHDPSIVRLGFDPAVSKHFRVFVLLYRRRQYDLPCQVYGVKIYSSESGEWTTHDNDCWGDSIITGYPAFFNGTLHLNTFRSSSVVTVDKDGEMWRTIPTPRDFDFIGQSQGKLYATHKVERNGFPHLSVWVLEDYASRQQWTRKHVLRTEELFGAGSRRTGEVRVHAIHPERGSIFLTVGKLRSLVSYDMDTNKMCHVSDLGANAVSVYPYIPSFSEL